MDQGRAGFTAYVHARSAALRRTAFLLTADRHLAEDLLREALTRVATRWESIVAGGDPEPYVRRVLCACARPHGGALMTAALHELLEDLASSERLDAPGVGERAWADGRARRRRRRVLEAVTAGAAVLAVLLALGPALGGARALPGPSFAGRFSTAEGAELADPVRVPVPVRDACGAAFGGTSGTLVVATLPGSELVVERVEEGSVRPQTVVADSVGGRCLVWAGAALDGPGRSGSGPWPLLLVSGAGVLALLARRRRLRR